MTKEELKAGMLVKIRTGALLKVVRDWYMNKTTATLSPKFIGVMSWENINADLSSNAWAKGSNSSPYDILEVYQPLSPTETFSFDPKDHKLIWEAQPEATEMSIKQLEERYGIRKLKIIGE